jgi:hypothetical protein
MNRATVVAVAVAALACLGIVAAQQPRSGPLVEVFKTPTCGCCSKWVEHMSANGFNVRTTDLNDVGPIKTARGVPDQLQSCHTAVVNGYVVEGHVPAADVHRLVKEKPAVAGIAVGGMPVGSPGMEYPGTKPQAYDVVSFDKAGATRVFAKH